MPELWETTECQGNRERQKGLSEIPRVQRKDVGWVRARKGRWASGNLEDPAASLEDRLPAEHPRTCARSLARSGAPSEECDAPCPPPTPGPGRQAPLLAAPGALPNPLPTPAGQ